MWFVCASSNNCTINPIDKWISRGEARTVGVCIEGAGAVPLRPALIPGGRPPPRLIHYLSTKLFRPPVAHNIRRQIHRGGYGTNTVSHMSGKAIDRFQCTWVAMIGKIHKLIAGYLGDGFG